MRLLGHKPRKELNCFSVFHGLISRPTSEIMIWAACSLMPGQLSQVRPSGGRLARPLTVQPAIRVRLTLFEPAHIMLLYEACRGKRTRPISKREFAQGS